MQSANENQADTQKEVAPPLGRTPSESVRVRKEQQGAVQFCARLGRTPTETQEMLSSAYQQDSLRKTVTKTYHKRFQTLGVDVYKSNPKAKKGKITGDKKYKPSSDERENEENGGANVTDNGKQDEMNVDQGEEQESEEEESPENSNESSDLSEVKKTREEGSTEKAVPEKAVPEKTEGVTEA